MHPPFDALRQHAFNCAAVEVCTTADLAARALNCTPDAARAALKNASDAGYFRSLLLPGMGNKLLYQPTPKAAHTRAPNIPKFLRAGLPSDARRRGLLRGYVRFAARPELAYLPTFEQSAQCLRYGVPERGHARSLVGLDGAHSHIFVPVLAVDKPIAAIEAAAFRWLPLLDSGTATLHFVTPAGEAAEAVRAALALLAQPATSANARRELTALDAAIQFDRTGLLAIQHAARRAALTGEITASGESESGGYSWLGDVVEVFV